MSALWTLFFGRDNTEPTRRKSFRDGWTEEQDRILCELWPTSHTTAEAIGKQMSPPRSKNAVIGRAKRLGLPSRRQNPKSGEIKIPAPRRGYPLIRKTAAKLPLFPEPQNWSPIGVTLLEATRDHCRAIIDSTAISMAGQTVYCGHPKVHGQPFSFCQYHLGLFIAPRIRRGRT